MLASFSGHWSSGAQLSGEEVNQNRSMSDQTPFLQVAKLVASRNHMAGFDLSHELFRAAYDIAFYSGFYPQFTFHFWIDVLLHNMVPPEDPENENYQALATRLWPQYLVDNLLIALRSCILNANLMFICCMLTGARSRKGGRFPPLL